MRFVTSAMATLLGAALVTGCGGGGGGGGSGTAPATGGVVSAPASGSWLTLTPNPVAVKSYEGESVRFQVKAKSSRTFDKPFNVAVIDSKGVVATNITVTKISALEYAVELRTNAAVAGTYATDLQVRLCEDDPLVCRTPLAGSPWQVPVTVTVATATQAQERLKFSPAAFDLVTYQGEPAAFSLVASATSAFPQAVQVGVFDSSGVLAAPVTMRELPVGHFSADLATASTLAVGEHPASLEVRVCLDDPRTCRSPVSGSPWRVPVKLAVKASTNLSALATIPSLSAWSTYNGNAAQNAWLPASFDPAAFNRRWNKPATAGTTVSAPVIENGRVFVIRSGAGKWELSATSEASGAQLWQVEIGAETGINALAAGNGRVYARVLAPEGGYLWTFDAATGQLAGKTRLRQPPELHRAPSVVGDTVYLGHSGGMEKFNAATGLIEWKNESMPLVGAGWTPVVDNGRAYAFLQGQVVALDTADGSVAFSVTDPAIVGTTGEPKSLVVDANLAVAKIGSKLLGIDLQSHARTWTADSSTVGQHVLANGTVYSLGEYGMVLEARAAATGVLQWKTEKLFTSSASSDSKRLIVTANLAFISGPAKTMAIDLATRQVVWSTPVGGELALSDRGVLYIVTAGGGLFAVNLR